MDNIKLKLTIPPKAGWPPFSEWEPYFDDYKAYYLWPFEEIYEPPMTPVLELLEYPADTEFTARLEIFLLGVGGPSFSSMQLRGTIDLGLVDSSLYGTARHIACPALNLYFGVGERGTSPVDYLDEDFPPGEGWISGRLTANAGEETKFGFNVVLSNPSAFNDGAEVILTYGEGEGSAPLGFWTGFVNAFEVQT